MSDIYITDEMIERARNANLAEYFKSGGYEFEQRRSEVHIRGYGGLYVNEETNQWSIEPYTENIFKGKVFCPHCGKPLHRQRAKRKTKPDVYRLYCYNIDEDFVNEYGYREKDDNGNYFLRLTRFDLLPLDKKHLADKDIYSLITVRAQGLSFVPFFAMVVRT